METTVSQPVASDATTSARIYLDQRFRQRVVYTVDKLAPDVIDDTNAERVRRSSGRRMDVIADEIVDNLRWTGPGTYEAAEAIMEVLCCNDPGTQFDLHFVGCAQLLLYYPMETVARKLCDTCCYSRVILENPLELDVGYKLMRFPWLRAFLPTPSGELRRLASAVSAMLMKDPRVLGGGPTYMDSHLMALRDTSVPAYIKTAILVSYGWRLNGRSVEVDDGPRSEVRKSFWDNGSG